VTSVVVLSWRQEETGHSAGGVVSMVTSRDEEEEQEASGVASADGKRARLEPAPTPAHTTALVPAPLPINRTSTRAAAAAVGSTRELLERVLGFLAGGSRGARGDVGRAASVCRLWRDVAYGEEVWGRMAAEMLPVLGGRRDGRRYVAEQGRCIVERRVWREGDWWEGLRLHLEVWDARDNLRILSAEGRLRVRELKDTIRLTIGGADGREVVGPAFSAASRDPEHHRFASMEDYFREAHNPDLPAAVCTRLVVSDAHTGRQALLLDLCETRVWTGQGDPRPDDIICFGPLGGGGVISTTWGDPAALTLNLNFCVRPEAGQEDVVARDRLYRATWGDDTYDSCWHVESEKSDMSDMGVVGKQIRSLLVD
jgi:hypothetical protein